MATIVYYDALDYPMTAFEVWKHLIATHDEVSSEAPTLGQVSGVLDGLVALGAITRLSGFLILPQRELLVSARIRSEKYAVPKIRRAAALAWKLAWVPFVRMIALTGSLSMKRGDHESDWDFFVVLSGGAIWRGRTALSLVLQLFGKRRHGRYVENRACLNYFITDASLEIAMQDYFSASEYRFMYTLVGRDTERHFELANRWMARLKPTYQPTTLPNFWLHSASRLQLKLRLLLEQLFSWEGWEVKLSSWQKKKIEQNPKSQTPGAFIVANDQALIFLPCPKGPAVFDRFKERLAVHGLLVS